ncbi:serine/threonine-protein kinase [Limnothrix sp. PR1529]|uniref:serine/threonine-protein kinase n=1 Tax=Limnothrix sp. PR1529 TaxID=1704291 RepID=UPI000C16204C|nr:serine/threonine-protein kinase [Limnothrix sp. PR1529]
MAPNTPPSPPPPGDRPPKSSLGKDPITIGQLLDKRYRILQVLGSGAFGKTYLAADLRRPGYPQCVVKQLRLLRPNPTAAKNAHRLFQREAEMLQRLGTHPQIPRLLAFFEENEQFYLVKEFAPGHPLSRELVVGEPLPEQRVISMVAEILEILSFVHGNRVIHRDIKPANLIRRSADGRLVLIDFGSVKEILQTDGESAAARTIAAGTPAYMPIEQFYGNPQFNSDIYAVGAIAIQALGGFSSEELQALRGSQEPVSGRLNWRASISVSTAFGTVLDKMVHPSYQQRYASAEEVLMDLLPLMGGNVGESITTAAEEELGNSIPWAEWWRRWWPWGLGLLGTVVGLATLWQSGLPQLAIAQMILSRWSQVPTGLVMNQNASPSDLVGIARMLEGKTPAPDRTWDYSKAIHDATQALVWSASSSAYFLRGVAYYNSGNWNAALADLNQALQLEASDAIARTYLAATQDRLGDLQSALASYDRAIQDNGKLSAAHLGRGFVRLQLSDAKGAIADFDKVLSQQSSWSAAYRGRALAKMLAGDSEGAITDSSQAIRLDPNNARAYQVRGRTHFASGNLPSALADLTVAIRLDSKDPESYYYRALTRQALGEPQGTLSDLNQAIALDDRYAMAYQQRGLVQVGLGNRAPAAADFRQAAKLCLDRGQLDCYDAARRELEKLQAMP